jgi:phosphatidylserine/phosphatidylglycerophosphate/cardiolipin synthase-like enzyme
VAEFVAGFLAAAHRSLEIALYDLRLAGAAADGVVAAVRDAHRRGVQVRVVFNQDHARKEPYPPPPRLDWDLLKRFDVPFHPVSGVPDLMHHKYVVRDAGEAEAAVLTGSANWTNDSWTREENFLVQVRSADLAAAYRRDFEDLWAKREVVASGHFSVPWSEPAPGLRARAFFSPGRGPQLAHAIARRIGTARRRIRILSPVITAGPILGALGDVAESRPQIVAGAYDLTQMLEVKRQWSENSHAAWKVQAFEAVDRAVPFGRKASTPWTEGGVHDFMHAKALVADDAVLFGSYNLSHSGEENAENVVEVEDRALADLFAAFAEQVAQRYGGSVPAAPDPSSAT